MNVEPPGKSELHTAYEEPSFLAANRLKVFVGAFILVSALSYFGFIAFKSATVYYYTVGELNELSVTTDRLQEGRLVRVSGKLVTESFKRPEDSVTAFFQLTDGDEILDASHDGVVPDLFFNEHSEIILEGSYSGTGVFHSKNIIVKCPSKYIAADTG